MTKHMPCNGTQFINQYYLLLVEGFLNALPQFLHYVRSLLTISHKHEISQRQTHNSLYVFDPWGKIRTIQRHNTITVTEKFTAKPLRITIVRISAVLLYFPTYIHSKNYSCVWTQTDGVPFNARCETLEKTSLFWSSWVKLEWSLESGYVTKLAHAYVIIIGALNVTLHLCIERNRWVILKSEPELNNKSSNFWAIWYFCFDWRWDWQIIRTHTINKEDIQSNKKVIIIIDLQFV
jgi:hypothetical protein